MAEIRVSQAFAEAAFPGDTPDNNARLSQLFVEVAVLPPFQEVLQTGQLQAYTYTPGIPTGSIITFSYETSIGLLSTQSYTYDLIEGYATILEDADGIPPSGTATCDVTPTVEWTALSGGEPYLYRWTVYAGNVSGSVAGSGVTLNQNQVELPELSAGRYTLSVAAVDSGGSGHLVADLLFDVLDCRRARPPRVIEMPAFDLEPALPQDEDYIRYLPQWMALHTPDPASGTFTFRFFQPALRQFRKASRQALDLIGTASVLGVPLRQPRLAWQLQSRYSPRDTLTATVRASGAVLSLTRASSLHQFLNADDPTFVLGDRGLLLFRNLAQRTVTVAPVSGTTGATGELLAYLSRQYLIEDEPVGMVRDADVFFQFAGTSYRIKAGSAGVDPDQAVIQLTAPFSGTITFTYQSRALLETVMVSLSGQPYQTPGQVDLPNRFDELGILAGLERRPGEDNVRFRRRIQSRFTSRIGTDRIAAAQHIAQDLTLTDVQDWDGRTAIDLPASGYFGVRSLEVRDLPELASVSEELARETYQRYHASKSDWLAGWVILVDGIPATRHRFPGLTVSGNQVDFGTPVSGVVTARYQYRNYTLSTSSQQFIQRLTPVAENTPSGSYQVILTKYVRTQRPSDPDYQREALLSAAGLANGQFRDLRLSLLEDSPVHLSRARWGKGASWLSESEDQPAVERLPVPLDTGNP